MSLKCSHSSGNINYPKVSQQNPIALWKCANPGMQDGCGRFAAEGADVTQASDPLNII